MPSLRSNGLTIEVERSGKESGVPLLLIAGLGSQLIYWPQRMIDALAGSGFSVTAIDNRDVGLSSKLSGAGVPDIAALRSKTRVLPSDVPYTLGDMADDATGVLDALGVPAAHVVGRSMGGMIAQALCARHPEKMLSLSLLVTTSAAPSLPPMRPDIEALLFGDGACDATIDREAILDASVEADRAWASPAYPFDPGERRALALASLERCHDPDGVARQAAALLCALRSGQEPPRLDVPALVVQGMADTIFPPAHGRDLALRISGADLLEIDGMGHDFEGVVVDIVTEAIICRVRSAERLHSG